MKFLPTRQRDWLRVPLVLAGLATALGVGVWWIMTMPGRSYRGVLPPLTAQEEEVRDRLRAHVSALAGEIGPRHVWHRDALQAAAAYVDQAMRSLGYDVALQEYEVLDEPVRNLEVELRGRTLPEEIIVVGAHYDTVPGCPGANDNGSGVAGLIEIARLLAGRRFDRTVRFVAFVNEEPPFFLTDRMGSHVYARRCRERGEAVRGAVALETIGFYSDAEGSQHYPFPFSLFYPARGDFIGFVGNLSSRDLVCRCVASFRQHTQFPSEGAALPGWITGVAWSDHWSFWRHGYPALMVTDTALFRYPHYHTADDTPDKLDYDRTARAVTGLARVVAELAGPGA